MMLILSSLSRLAQRNSFILSSLKIETLYNSLNQLPHGKIQTLQLNYANFHQTFILHFRITKTAL